MKSLPDTIPKSDGHQLIDARADTPADEMRQVATPNRLYRLILGETNLEIGLTKTIQWEPTTR